MTRRPASLLKIFSILVSLSCSLFLFPSNILSAPAKDFYYYNPDSLQSNLSHLKAEMDIILARVGYPINFQPFAHHLDFSKKTYENRPAFLFIPDWYLKKHGARLNLRPFLIPLRNKSNHYKKVLLITKKSKVSYRNFRNHSLAMTTMGPGSENILNRILFSRHNLDAANLNIVRVPKDSDGIFALTLGQVDMALVTKKNIDQLKKINPVILNSLKSLDESLPIQLPLLCYIKGKVTNAELEKLKKVFLRWGRQKTDLKTMEMLQIDEWKAIGN